MQPPLSGFQETRLQAQASCWPQTRSVQGLSAGAASDTPIRATHRPAEISPQRQPPVTCQDLSQLPVTAVSGGRGQDTPSRLSFPATRSKSRGGPGQMVERGAVEGSQTDKQAFQSMSQPSKELNPEQGLR